MSKVKVKGEKKYEKKNITFGQLKKNVTLSSRK